MSATMSDREFWPVLVAMGEADKICLKTSIDFGPDATSFSNSHLRFAGYHVIRAIHSDAAKEKEEQIGFAMEHCNVAAQEAFRLHIDELTRKFSEFITRYSKISITDVLPKIVNYTRDAESARALLDAGVEVNSTDEDFAEVYKKLSANDGVCQAAQKELLKKIKLVHTKQIQLFTAVVVAVCVVTTLVLKLMHII
jgi:hypothetical protein